MQKIGFLGCGRVSQRHMEVCRDELKNAKVTFVCDIVKNKADQRGKELGAQVTYDLKEILESPEVDIILIMTESGKHAEHSRLALDAGKHVIVEKPPALLPNQILELENHALSKGLMYAVIFQNRFNPAMQILKKTFDSGRFGKIVLATIRLRWCRYPEYYQDGWHGTWKMDGGVINQQAIHHIDALQWICGPVEKVVSAQSNAINKLEAEDTTVAIMKFSSGHLGAVEATTAVRPEDIEASINIIGERGLACIGGIALNLVDKWQFVEPTKEDLDVPKKYSQQVPTGYGLSHGPLIQKIVDLLNLGKTEPPVSGSDAVSSLKLVHAIYSSFEEDGWVTLKDQPISKYLGINN